MSRTISTNPHWIGKKHHRDIILPDGTLEKDVPDYRLAGKGIIVKEYHVQDYGKRRMRKKIRDMLSNLGEKGKLHLHEICSDYIARHDKAEDAYYLADKICKEVEGGRRAP